MAKNETITLPKGVAVFPALFRADTKFDELGQYKANVRVPLAEAEPTIKKLQAIVKAWTGKAYPKAKNPMWEIEVNDDGDETGYVLFKASVKNRLNKEGKLWDRKPVLIDAKKQPLDADVNPWGGSVIRPKCEIYLSEFGGKRSASLQPIMVQVIELKTGGGREIDTDDFDEEDGYEGSSGAPDTSDFEDEGDTNSSAADDDQY